MNTVVYLDNSTNYEAKSTPTGILVRKLGDMSSLDVLEGISDVRFNDRVFDRAAGWELACFLKGTRIATGRGGVPVEDLRIDDQVITAHGHERPVVWIGHRRIDCRRHPDPRTIWPVRIAAGVFGSGRPHRDLWLSPDHAVFVDNVLIPVKHLVNGTSIAQVRVDEVTYYHVELPSHDAILAEGLPAESYLDTGDRSGFANGGDPVALYPDFASMVRDAEGFAPLIVTGPRLDAVRGWLNDWAADAMASRSRLVANSHTAAGAAAVPRAPPSRNPRFVRHM